MTAPAITLSLSSAAAIVAKKKRVLLVDACTTKRDLRAGVMRRLGIEVDCAADIGEARSLWRADWYGLVLVNVGAELGVRDEFCDEIRGARPPQKVAFLVGRPEFLAAIPAGDGAADIVEVGDPRLWAEVVARLFTQASKKGRQTWGIQEACWRISAVRSLSDPRPKDDLRPSPTAENPKPSRWADEVRRHSKSAAIDLPMLPESGEGTLS
jgi:CheY-like chemotaxis protein